MPIYVHLIFFSFAFFFVFVVDVVRFVVDFLLSCWNELALIRYHKVTKHFFFNIIIILAYILWRYTIYIVWIDGEIIFHQNQLLICGSCAKNEDPKCCRWNHFDTRCTCIYNVEIEKYPRGMSFPQSKQTHKFPIWRTQFSFTFSCDLMTMMITLMMIRLNTFSYIN